MINPFDLCKTLLTIGSYSTLLQDYVIKLSPDSWLIKAVANNYIATIKPTEFDTIEFTIPIASIEEDSDEAVSQVVDSTEFMNGHLLIRNTSKGLLFFYTTYLPATMVTDIDKLMEFGILIVKEMRFIKEGLNLLRMQDNEGVEGTLNADKFNSMMEDYNSNKDEEGN